MEALMKLSHRQMALLLAGLSALFFVPFLGQAHLFDWDEINFAEASREMLLTGNITAVTIDFEPFWEKPPLFFWLQMLSMKLFGVNEFAARFPNAICGIITVVMLFNLGVRYRNAQFGLLWALMYMGSLLPHFYFKSGIIDPWFNLFIFLGIWQFMRGTEDRRMLPFVWSGVFTGLAVMTKGPVGLLIVLMVTGLWWMTQKFKKHFSLTQVLAWTGAFLFTGSLWFISEILAGRGHIIQEFIDYQIRLFNTQDAGHGGPFFYHWIVLLLGCFPASFFLVPGIRNHFVKFQKHDRHIQAQIIMLWSVLLLFSIVKTKIVHYSSLCYFPLTFLAVDAILSRDKPALFSRIGMLTTVFILGSALVIMPFFEHLKPWVVSNITIKDPFAMANMDASANWMGFEWLSGVLLIAATLWFIFIRNKTLQAKLPLFLLMTTLGINLAVSTYPQQVEAYSQRAAIEFYQAHENEECLIYPIGFKSYAHLFYSRKPMGLPSHNAQPEAMLTIENPGYPVYFVTKINRAEELSAASPRLRELYRKNGFVFYVLGD
jgi:4-amino-4-deoxy-L-arabinose transferase-like glycosyltransferase